MSWCPGRGPCCGELAPWGHWRIWGRNRDYEAVVEATAGPNEGTPLRAPTYDGLVPACKDTFFGKVSASRGSCVAEHHLACACCAAAWLAPAQDTCWRKMGPSNWLQVMPMLT